MVAIASRMDTHRFERVPSVMPARRPAADRSWHGLPPLMMSTGSTCDQSTVVTSRWFGMPGQWCAMIFDGASSNSAYQVSSASKTSSTAIPSPPNPAKSSPNFSFVTLPPPPRRFRG